jgi:small subunit ribosomal protein S1
MMNDNSFNIPMPGDSLTGVILSISSKGLLIDIGAKSEGVIAEHEMERIAPELLAKLKTGDEVHVSVVEAEDEYGFVALSLEQAQPEIAWKVVQELFESQQIFEKIVTGWNKGGLIVDFDGVDGFVPISQVRSFLRQTGDGSIKNRLARMVGKTLPLKVLEVDRKRNRLILSARAAERKWRQQRREHLLATLQEGDIVEGEVQGLADFGAFVDLGGAAGLVHLSELTWGHISHPSEVLQVGDRVSVYVLDVDQDRSRIALSLKRLHPEPWSQVEEKYVIDQLVGGEITNLTDFGAFVLVEEGIEGLIHISELSDRPPSHPGEIVAVGDVVLVRVISIDANRQRMALSLKRVDPSELIKWEKEHQQAQVESKGPIQRLVKQRRKEPDDQIAIQESVDGDKEPTTQPPDRRPKVLSKSPSLSGQIVQEIEDSLVLDTVVHMSPLLEADLDECILVPPSHLEIDYSYPTEQLAAQLFQKATDKNLEWQVQATLSLQAAKLLSSLGYNLSNKQMREYVCAYCNMQGDGYFIEKLYDTSGAYYREAFRLLPRDVSYEVSLTPGTMLRYLKTFVHAYTVLKNAPDFQSLFLAATASANPRLMDRLALGLIGLATVSFNYIKQVLEEARLNSDTEPNFLRRLGESLRRILERNGQEANSDAGLMVLLQRAVSTKNLIENDLKVLLNDLIANSYTLNRLHLLESTFADIRSLGPLALCPTDKTMLERAYEIYENLIMKYIAQERFVDKKIYYEEVIRKIRQLHSVTQKTPTQYGKVLVDELLFVWKTTLSVEYCLEAALTGSEYLDRIRDLGQLFEMLEGLKKVIYDPADRDVIDHLQSIYQGLLQYSSQESSKDKILLYEELRKQLEVIMGSVLAKRTDLGIQHFIPILNKWQNILADDYQSFLTRAARKQQGPARRWKLSEEELLRTDYEKMTDLELAALLGRTEASIVAKMRQMKLKRRKGVFEEEQKEHWQNPYIVGPPVKTQEMFFGRQDIFDYIQRNLVGPYQHNTIVLQGRRRTGKSSILYQIQRRDLLKPCITVLIDTQGLGRLTMPLLFYKLSSQVSKALQKSAITISLPLQTEFTQDPFWRFTEFLDNVELAIGGQKLILMIDEFEKIQDEIKLGRLDVDLYDNFRHIIQHREDVGFILAGTMRMEEIVKDYTSPFFNSSLLLPVSFLREDEAVALIRKPIEKRIVYEDQSVNRILALTAGHPYFIQLTCQTLVNHLTYRKRNVVVPEDVDYVLGDVLSAGEGQFIFEWTSDTSSLDKLILSWLATRIETEASECPMSEIENAFSRLLAQPRFSNTTILETLDRLQDKEIVNVRQSKMSFRVDLYRRWIKQNKDSNRVCKEERIDQSLLK